MDWSTADPLRAARYLHLVGIGGSGMSSLAALLASQGRQVSGSDLSPEAVSRLTGQGLRAVVGHRPENLGAAELVIRSAAIPDDSPELEAAARLGVPVITHAQALGLLMHESVGVAVAGTHGKTTTTALTGHLLAECGFDPTVLVGAVASNFGSGARLGKGSLLVVEADEFNRRFLDLRPRAAIITGIEPDHLDYFRDFADVLSAFQAFADLVPEEGVIIVSADDSAARGLRFAARRLTYGFSADADWRVSEFEPVPGGGCRFQIAGPDGFAEARVSLHGRHNSLNVCAAVALASTLGAPLDRLIEAAASFSGTERRFATAFRDERVWIVDDYAHHPTAVRATLAAAREIHSGRLWAVFQPHTANRLAELMDDFASCFGSADRLILLPAYEPAGRVRRGQSVGSADLAWRVVGPETQQADSFEEALGQLRAALSPGDLVIVMGAGDIPTLSQALVAHLQLSATGPRE